MHLGVACLLEVDVCLGVVCLFGVEECSSGVVDC